ncbi:hypothetical protein [Phenylobacterium sp.]|uniref:hypothetical protein n=1 Tax=Phenylobacterium sp. TaxID=1871053 RepID=UPI002DED7145|nr:hypothetical protein [Phenylobacterium sp.]
MAVWREKGRKTYRYDFRQDGERYYGTTGTRLKWQAVDVERDMKALAAQGLLTPWRPPAGEPAAVLQAWSIAGEITGGAYGLPADLLSSQSRGRGPRPPRAAWEARKMAVHLVILVLDCPYATLARAIGLNKDTVASHCADMREACAESDRVERLSEALETCLRTRLALVDLDGTRTLRSAA